MDLTSEGCRNRRARLLQTVEADLIVINNPRHIQYLSGLYISPLGLSGWGPNFLLLDKTGKSTLLVHNFIEAEAGSAYVDEVIVWRWYDSATQPGLPVFREAISQLNNLLSRLAAKRIGFEAGWLPREIEVGKGVDITDILLEMRRRKDPDELQLIRETIQAIEAGHAAARQIIKPKLSEIDVFNAIYSAINKVSNGPVLPMGDYVSGDRASLIGGPPTGRILMPGDLMILDIYPIINGYRADFTTTLSVNGQLDQNQRKLETALHTAIVKGEEHLRAGMQTREIYNIIKISLDKFGFGEGFVHHAGHGLGLGHPETPFIVPESLEVLVPGDFITLEPGSYGKDFGARIEHNYLILEDGFERLTNHRTSFVPSG
jgi:Xaa-Pro aminopeptidase